MEIDQSALYYWITCIIFCMSTVFAFVKCMWIFFSFFFITDIADNQKCEDVSSELQFVSVMSA